MALELERTIEVFSLSAAVAREGIDGTVNLDAALRGKDTIGIVRAEPIGPVLGITAFNGPMLIAAHKIAPAIVAGTTVIIKPSPRVPRSAVLLARYVVQAGWPADALAVLPLDNDATMRIIHDPRLPLITFTGGDVGWKIKDAVPRKRVHLELGGVGAVIVAADADLELAAEQCTAGGFVRSGQACLAVQRIYVEQAAYERFAGLMAARVQALVTGACSAAAPATVRWSSRPCWRTSRLRCGLCGSRLLGRSSRLPLSAHWRRQWQRPMRCPARSISGSIPTIWMWR
jgi:acyl-CoA reductase-like NAD-dependent aldehyde dehydrogenase